MSFDFRKIKIRCDPKVFIWQLLRIGDIHSEAEKRQAWLKLHPYETNEDDEVVILNALSYSTVPEVVMQLKTAEQCRTVVELQEKVQEAFKNLPIEYKDILQALAIEKLSWRYISASMQITNRKIKQLKDAALGALLSMLS